jgi:hypothetical protein
VLSALLRLLQVLLPRLQQCEQRLAGVSNLAGALMAVEQIAAEVSICKCCAQCVVCTSNFYPREAGGSWKA